MNPKRAFEYEGVEVEIGRIGTYGWDYRFEYNGQSYFSPKWYKAEATAIKEAKSRIDILCL